jgi:hypothetical protein
MGARDVKRGLWSQLLDSHLGLIVLLLFLDTGISVHGTNITIIYVPAEQNALQTLWEAWQGSPDLSSNLADWSPSPDPTKDRFCDYLDPNSNASISPSWQGVQCSFSCNVSLAIDPNCTVRQAYVIGLYLTNASIVGVLPPDIANITFLYTLQLTGNPNLTGPLPEEIQNTWMNVLDVHDNAFNGTIPSLLSLWNLLQLDLSGNRFTGPYPFEQFETMTYLQQISIGDNLLEGEIPVDVFTNKTELTIL